MKAAFEVLPEFELGDYKAIKVEKPEINISDEQIDAEIKLVQERQASYDPVNEDRGAENGDFVQVSFEAKPKGIEEELEAMKAEAAASGKAIAQPKNDAAQPVQMDEVLVEIGGANTFLNLPSI